MAGRVGGLRPRDAGQVVYVDPGADKPLLEVGTLCCMHCGAHWIPEPGSGRIRGYCQLCCGPVCGPGCAKCVPMEQMLENIEKGRPEDYRPVVVGVHLPRESTPPPSP